MPQQKISFPDEVWAIVQSYAKTSGLTESEIVRTLALLGLPHYTPSITALRQGQEEASLTATLIKLLAGVDVPEHELSKAGYQAGISLEDMCRLKDCLRKTGGRKDAVQC